MPAASALGSAFPKHANSGAGEESFFAKHVPWCAELFNRRTLPKDWDGHKLDVDGEPAHFFYSPAKDPRGIAVYITGLQSSPLEHIEGVENLKNHGISVISLSLLPATQEDLSGEKCRYIKRNGRLFEEALFNPKSKIHALGNKDLPRYIMPHSTASLVLQYTLKRGDNHEKARDLFDGAYNLNPFFDAGLASHHNPLRSLVYEWYAHGHAKDPILSAPLERLVIGKNQASVNDYYYGAPTHGLVMGILDKSRPVVRDILRDGLPTSKKSAHEHFPQVFVVGSNDGLVCNTTTKDIARALKAPVLEHPIDHGGALRTPESLQHLIETIKTPRSDRHNTKSANLPTTPSFMPEVLSRFF